MDPKSLLGIIVQVFFLWKEWEKNHCGLIKELFYGFITFITHGLNLSETRIFGSN